MCSTKVKWRGVLKRILKMHRHCGGVYACVDEIFKLSSSFPRVQEKYRTCSSTYLVSTIRMPAKNLITEKIPNERRRNSIGYRLEVQRGRGEKSERKDGDEKENSNDQIAGM